MQLQFTETKDIFSSNHIVILFSQFKQVFFPALQELLATTTQLKAQENKNEKAFEAALKKFLQSSFYAKNYVGNKPYKKGEADLVISQGVDIQTNTSVLFEVKSPLDKAAMISQADFNKKSLQQAITYFFTEIVEKKNFDLKRIIITNTEDFFIFDATEFHRLFYHSDLKKAFENWHSKQQVGTSTTDFYAQVANFVNSQDLLSLTCVHFNINDLDSTELRMFSPDINFYILDEKENFKGLKFLYKIFSPQYLLKITDTIDSNELNEPFYLELLHILGVEEITKSGKTIIQRKANNRDIGSFLELTMHEIALQKKTLNLDKTVYGHTQEEQIFHAALELSITWVNRILFLKLLESQLINFNHKDNDYAFLNLQILPNFSEVFILFHKVLAIKEHERETNLQEKYKFVPYLNSSLFEISELEQQFININALGNGNIITVISSTVLQNHAKKLTTLDYFLRFLNSYNFSSEGKKQEVSQDNEPVINAAILGKIFEKINGYKDGAVFTPASITMYMCRRSIRMAVVQKFNEIKQWNCVSFEELKEKIEDKREANAIINTLKICDPAVGSGHFLVSALNEIIAIKSELGVLFDRNNRRITDYKITVVNDELEIKEIYNDTFFVYRKTKIINEIQLLQEALFHEKQTIIENCLFGVDINPNSVKICRLRLWIELLKNAYYISPPPPEGGVNRSKTPPSRAVVLADGLRKLQTLPNIDINIKVGNSLISRFATDVDLKQVLKKIKYNVDDYRKLVNNYKNVRNSEEKYKIEQAIAEIKNGFRTEIAKFSDPRILRLQRIEAELFLRETDDLFNTGTDKKEGNGEGNGVERDKIKKLQAEKQELSQALEAVKNNIAYEWAFEWRFEFPEVLSDDGEFLGFDVVIGNPPYGVSQQGNLRIKLLENLGKVPDFEIYYFFINRSKQLLKPKGLNAFIIPNTILFNVFAKEYREQLFENWNIHELLDCTGVDVFKGKATVRNVLTFLTNEVSKNEILYKPTAKITSFDDLIDRDFCTTSQEVLLENNQNWALVFKLSAKTIELTRKIRRDKGLLKDYFPDISQGLIAYDKYQGQDEATIENRIYHSLEPQIGWKKFLWGRDVTHYAVKWNEKEYINYCDELANPRKPKYFKGERLLIREITNPRIFVAYTKEESYYDPAIIVILKNPNGLLHIKALLAILNSKLATFLHFNSSPKATKGAFPKILVNDIKSFPIPDISADAQKPFIKLVDKILLAKSQEKNTQKDTQNLENQVDKLVYDLYDLTEEEIEVVEKSVR